MMKLTHILASAAIISTLSACNGSLQTADRTPVDYVNPYIGNISHLLVPTFPTIQLPNSCFVFTRNVPITPPNC